MTKIEWVKNSDGTQGKSWNPITGCTPVSPGCKNCYAESIAKWRWGERKFSDIQLHKDRLDHPLKWKEPLRIFVCSMSDLFLEVVPMDYILQVFDRMEQAKQHTFMLLTKRPKRAYEFCQKYGIGDVNPWPQNIWMGITAENQYAFDTRIWLLTQIPAQFRFISIEPMLGLMIIWPWLNKGIDWVICGSESGPKRRPAKIEWIRDLRDQCITAGVPFFLKQMEIDGKLVKLPKLDGRIWDQMPTPNGG